MRQLLSPNEYMLYHVLWRGGHPATLAALTERWRNNPYERELSLVYVAAVAGRLEEKGYVTSKKVSLGERGQPPTSLTPIVPLAQVIRAQAQRDLEQLAWDDREVLEMIRTLVDEALAKAAKPKRKAPKVKRPASRAGKTAL